MISLAWVLLAAQLAAWPVKGADVVSGGEARMTVVGPGVYEPLFPVSPREREIPVAAFRLDRAPVTNGEFLAFVGTHGEWRRDRVERLLADEQYLERWQAPDALGPAVDPKEPVVDVSWYAARAYCAARGLRLPTEAQSELAASLNGAKFDALFEWVLDFDAAGLAAGGLQVCAGGAAGASGSKTDFAMFERFAMRTALRASYTTHHLGFRCAGPVLGGMS